jgi:glutathione synthase/RimK-type ligase-like ATP-grasp enzyme
MIIAMNINLEVFSENLRNNAFKAKSILVPHFRQFFRFMALPYCFSKVNWQECTKTKAQVALDFIYIFFVLKYYPDNYSPCRFWEKTRSEWAFYYGSNYNPYQRRKLRKMVQPVIYDIVFDDKLIAEMVCRASNINTPNILGIVKKNECIATAVEKFSENGFENLIFKPRWGEGGQGIICTERKDRAVIGVVRGELVSLEGMKAEDEYIVQPFIVQHNGMKNISSSTNTIRVVTLRSYNGNIIIVGTYARFGVGSSKVDNLSQGGICVSVDIDTGRLLHTGFDRMSHLFNAHPTSGVVFKGYEIPLWDQVIDLARMVQSSFEFYPLLGMDIAVTADGPIVIEINPGYDNVDLEQASGPVLRRPEVYQAYMEYDLFINRHQKSLKYIN